MINAIKGLTAQKLTIYLLTIAVGALWYKLETTEVKGDGKDEKKEVRQDRFQAKLDSIQNVRISEKQDCAEQIQAIKQEEIEDLKKRIAEQNAVKSRARRTEQVVNNVINETKTKLTE